MKFTLTKKGLFGFIPLGAYGVTIYPHWLPMFRSRYWALYDYIDHITDFPNKKTEAELWQMLEEVK